MENAPGSPARLAESRQPETYALTIVFTFISCIAVCLRTYTRTKIVRRFGRDDIAIAVAEIFSLGVCALTIVCLARGGLGRHTEFITPPEVSIGATTAYSSIQVYNVAQLLTKVSFLLQYRRIFPSDKIRKISLYGLGFIVVWGIIQQFLNIFACSPLVMIIPNWHTFCVSTWPVYNSSGIMSIVTDVMIFSIPIYPVLHLRISRAQKCYLLLIFSLGFFVCAVSIVRFYKLSHNWHSHDLVYDSAVGTYWSNVELNLGITCACMPTLRPLIKKFAPGLVGSPPHADPRNNKLNTVHLTCTSPGDTNTTAGQNPDELEFQTTPQSYSVNSKVSVSIGEKSLEDRQARGRIEV